MKWLKRFLGSSAYDQGHQDGYKEGYKEGQDWGHEHGACKHSHPFEELGAQMAAARLRVNVRDKRPGYDFGWANGDRSTTK